MSDAPIPFENSAESQLRGAEAADQDLSSQVVAYRDQQGQPSPQTGNCTGPYSVIVARASADGSTGLVPVQNGQDQRPATDLLGRWWVVEAAPTVAEAALRYRSAVLEQAASIATGQFVVEEIRMIISPGVSADRYLMVFDKASAPVNADVPDWSAVLPNVGVGAGEVWDSFIPFAVTAGLAVAVSTTPLTLTLPGVAQAIFQVLYKAAL